MEQAYRVIESYTSPFPDPLVAKAGARLRFESKESEWAGWLWCEDAEGKGGWVPESWLTLQVGSATLRRDYTARELSVQEGEMIEAKFAESGWVFGSTEGGEEGWVPLDHLAPAAGELELYPLSKETQVKMLGKLMLFWDGQWFLKAVETFGLEAAIDLNARVRTSFGRIEMRTMLKAAGKSQADDLPDAMRLLQTYARTFMGDRLRAEFSVLSDEQAQVVIRRCAAYEGAKLAGLPRKDQACVACETLWNAWFETLLPGTKFKVALPARQGKGAPICRIIATLCRDAS